MDCSIYAIGLWYDHINSDLKVETIYTLNWGHKFYNPHSPLCHTLSQKVEPPPPLIREVIYEWPLKLL